MAEVAHGAQHDFWHPPMQTVIPETSAVQELVEACDRCGTEFIVGSRFCHSCGTSRPEASTVSRPGAAATVLQVSNLAERLGLPFGSFIALAVGIVCLISALAVGIVFSAKTVMDWQAIQLWRIEWLLASIAAFLVGCVLKRKV